MAAESTSCPASQITWRREPPVLCKKTTVLEKNCSELPVHTKFARTTLFVCFLIISSLQAHCSVEPFVFRGQNGIPSPLNDSAAYRKSNILAITTVRCLYAHRGLWPWQKATSHGFWFDNVLRGLGCSHRSWPSFGNARQAPHLQTKHNPTDFCLRLCLFRGPRCGKVSATRCGRCFWCNTCVALLQQDDREGWMECFVSHCPAAALKFHWYDEKSNTLLLGILPHQR